MKALATFLFILSIGGSALTQERDADLVIFNGEILTMDPGKPRVEAVAIIGTRFVSVGTNAEVRRLVGIRTTVIDAAGKIVIPGINDAHVHFMAIGNKFSSVDLRNVGSFDEMRQLFAYFVRFLPKGRWILGSGWNDRNLQPPSASTIRLIDDLTPDNPIFVYSADPSVAFANARALTIARISRNTPDPIDGTIVRDISGEPTGVLKGKALQLLIRHIPPDHTRRWSEIAETASNYAASYGVTSVQDTDSDDRADVYRELERLGKLKTRIYDCKGLSEWAKTKKLPEFDNPDSMVTTGCVKGFHEGDDDWTPKLREDVIAADKAGWQVAIHAIGAKSNRIVLDIIEETIRLNGKRDRRFRIEHAEGIASADLSRLGRLGITLSIQPYLFGRGAGYRSGYYERLRRAGAKLALGSDAPMTEFDPLLLLSAGNDGKLEFNNGSWLTSIIHSHTIGSAFAEFKEKVKGQIAVGKLADLVILSQNRVSSAPDAPHVANVSVTVANGRIVYQRSY